MEEPSCDCTTLGGWAPRVEECDTLSETGCCLCPPEDAGVDAGEDAGEDAGLDADGGPDGGADGR